MQMVALEQHQQTETGCDGMKATINYYYYYYYATSYYNTTINNKMNNITYLLETIGMRLVHHCHISQHIWFCCVGFFPCCVVCDFLTPSVPTIHSLVCV
jgi:hypothetical protein